MMWLLQVLLKKRLKVNMVVVQLIKILETLTLDDAFTSLIGKFRVGSSQQESVIVYLFFLISETLSQLHLEPYLLYL